MPASVFSQSKIGIKCVSIILSELVFAKKLLG